MSLIVKNTTVLDIVIRETGDTIPASGQLTIDPVNYAYYAKPETITEITTTVNAGDLIINDGTRDLAATEAFDYLRHRESLGIPFRSSPNRTNDFLAKNLQEAIEEIDFRTIKSDPTGIPDPAGSYISFDNGTRTFTITATASDFKYYIRGREYTVTGSDSVQIPDTEGVWYIHYSGNTLTASQTEWVYGEPEVHVGVVYWSVAAQEAITLFDKRNGLMPWQTQDYIQHTMRATQKLDRPFSFYGFAVNESGNLDTHAQFSVTEGILHNIDLEHTLVDSDTPTNDWEQKLSEANIPLLYRDGASGGWRKTTATAFPLVYDGVNPCKYNLFSGGSWSLTSINDGWFSETFVFITPDPRHPVIGVVGYQQQLSAAEITETKINDLLDGLSISDMFFVGKFIWESNTSFANTPKARFRKVTNVLDTIDTSDRYSIPAWYIGNATTGKYLDYFSGISSNEAPLLIPENSIIRTITLVCVSNSTGTLGFYTVVGGVVSSTPSFTVSLTNEKSKTFGFAEYFPANTEIAIKVSSGSLNKPTVRLWVQTEA